MVNKLRVMPKSSAWAAASVIAAFFLICSLFAAGGRAPAPAAAQAADPAAATQALIDTINGGDLAAILAYYHDDAVLIGSSVCPAATCTGAAAIQRHYQNIVATHSRIVLLGVQASGDTVTGRTEVRSDTTTAAGVDRAVLTITVTFSGGLISRHLLQFDLSDPQTAQFVAFVQALAQQTQPGQVQAPAAAPGSGR